MYLRCPACRNVTFVPGEESTAKCRRCGGTMKAVEASLPAVLRPTRRRRRVREEDLDISEPAPQAMTVEEGLEASHWIRKVFGR